MGQAVAAGLAAGWFVFAVGFLRFVGRGITVHGGFRSDQSASSRFSKHNRRDRPSTEQHRDEEQPLVNLNKIKQHRCHERDGCAR
jgi:hypothetical protein